MPEIRILRVKRTDSSDVLLLHITQTSSTRPLDLKLIATDQEHIYHGSVKNSQVSKTRSEQFTGDEDELRDVLLFSLMRDRPEGVTQSVLQGLEVVAVLKNDVATITVRKNIGGITQRVAAITLEQDDDREEVGAFDWVEQAEATSDELRQELENMQSTITTQQDEITKLKARLKEFIEVKKKGDEELLVKFAALLNSKKQKIRELKHGVQTDAMQVDRSPAKRKAADEDQDMDDHDDETPEQTDDEEQLTTAGLPPSIELPFGKKKASAVETTAHDGDETEDEL